MRRFSRDNRHRTIKKSKFTETQIVSILKEADICRKHGISQPTYYHWKSKYGVSG